MSAAWFISASSRPPRLSSASSSLGWVASARAISSFFRPAAPMPSTRRLRVGGQPDQSQCLARPLLGALARDALGRAVDSAASVAFSRTDSLRNGRGIWKVRASPRRQISLGGRPPICSPSSRDRAGRSARTAPAITLKVVLLPDPLGPIRPRISPLAKPNDTRVDGCEAAEPLCQALDRQQHAPLHRRAQRA